MTTGLSAPRPLAAAELEQLFHVDEIAFLSAPYPDEVRELQRSVIGARRSIGVFDGPGLVAGGTILDFEMTVPGGSVPMAGVTYICVLPTHRRRGILSAMMRHQLHGLHEDGGEPVAGLTASEPPIYGRFGYGQATWGMSFTVPRHKNAVRLPAGTEDVTLRLADTAATFDLCEEIYARQVPSRPGMLTRSPAWARALASDIDVFREGRSALRTIIAARDGKDVGFARYRTKEEWAAIPNGQVDVAELHADDAPSYAALLRFLVDIDLSAKASFGRCAIDSIPVHLLADIRAAEPGIRDGLYLRLVDVDRALSARTYSAPVDVVFELVDEFCPWNAGRWRLTGDEKSAACERTTSAADLAIGVRELASAYLGGTTLRALSAAGLVEEHRSGAVAEASKAFAVDLAPWLPFGF
jgi:predicted acetyltransferase